MKAIGENIFYKVSFPECLSSGKQVYYTVYNSDGSTYIARTNSGVVDFENGNFGVSLIFNDAGGYLIVWDIDSTTYTVSEEINIYNYGSDSDIENIINTIQAVYDIEYGKWEIDENTIELIFYKPDNVTEIARFDLKDVLGNPAYINVFSRVRK